MTSICTSLGLVPMALGIGEGAELQAPLARVVIGGLLTSTLITLVFVPAMYTLFEEGLGAVPPRPLARRRRRALARVARPAPDGAGCLRLARTAGARATTPPSSAR